MPAAPTLERDGLDLPAQPDLARMRRERGKRLRTLMADKGVDALVLLGNANVSYATGATWPLSDAGRGHVHAPAPHLPRNADGF